MKKSNFGKLSFMFFTVFCFSVLFIFTFLPCVPAFAQEDLFISTVAGTGSAGYSGDGGSATSAQLDSASGVAFDSSGNMYIADYHNNCIRKVDSSGNISTVVGTGTEGYSGDGGAATSAELDRPAGIAFDSSGNMYIADYGNSRIRKVDSDGNISMVAGSNSWYSYSGDGGPATSAGLYGPEGIAFDSSGNMYIADSGNNRIRKVDSAGNISTVAGNGNKGYSGDGGPATEAELQGPAGIAFDSSGNMYIADKYNNCIRKVDSAGNISTVAGPGKWGYLGDGGTATSAWLNNPNGVAFDSSGNMYIADNGNNRIRKVDTSGIITTVAGTGNAGYSGNGGPATSAQLKSPSGVAFDSSGNMYIADSGNNRIRKIGPATWQNSVITPTTASFDIKASAQDDVTITLTLNGNTLLSIVNGTTTLVQGTDYLVNDDTVIINKAYLATQAVGECSLTFNFSAGLAQTFVITVSDSTPPTLPSYISTVVGTGTAGYSGDGESATSARLKYPQGVAFDSSGNMYIADYENNRIRKVDSAGNISTVAGTGTAGYSGDGGPAISAGLYHPSGLTFDSSGNMYIADYNRIRKVDTSGNISTIAGTGTAGYSGDGGPATSAQLSYPAGITFDSSGNMYIVDQGNNCIRKVDSAGNISTVAGTGTAGYSGDGGPATSAQLSYPSGLTFDSSGNMYIADKSNNRIRKVDTSGNISTVAGTGTSGYSGDGGPATSAQLNYPSGLTFDSSGNMYIADRGNNRIRKVDSSGKISTIAGNGTNGYSGDYGLAISAQLYYPSGIAFDSSGNMYIADCNNNRIRKIGPATWGNSIISPSAANFDKNPSLQADVTTTMTLNGNTLLSIYNGKSGLNLDYDYTVTDNTVTIKKEYLEWQAVGNIILTFNFNNGLPQTLRVTVTQGRVVISTVAGTGTEGYSGDGGPATSAQLYYPYGVAFDSSENMYIADKYNNRIRKVDSAGKISTVAGTGIYGYAGDKGTATSAQLKYPSGVAFDSSGNMYIADNENNRIRKVDTSGNISTIAGNGTSGYSGDGGPAISAQLSYPSGVVFDSSGNMYIADSSNNSIRKVDNAGNISTVAGNGKAGNSGDGGPATAAYLYRPSGVAFDSSGNMYIADKYNNRIRKVDSSGNISTVAGTGTEGYSGDGGSATSARLKYPSGVAFDSSGNMYIADSSNHCIRKVGSSGNISTVAGTGTEGYSGDGGAATSAQLRSPSGVAFDSSGNMYIADSYCIRKIGPAGIINLVTGNFDRNPSAQADITTTMMIDSNTLLSSISNDETTLVQDADYTINGNTVTIKKEYLAKQVCGTCILTLKFNAGADQTLSITIIDSRYIDPNISDFNISLYTEFSDKPSVIIKQNSQKGTAVYGDNARIENTDFYFCRGEDGTYYYRFQTQSSSYPQAPSMLEFTPKISGEIFIKIYSMPHLGINDVNGINIRIHNDTDLPLTVISFNDDKESPRVARVEADKGPLRVCVYDISSTYFQEIPSLVYQPFIDSTISPKTSTFDKNSSIQSDVSITMTLNGNTLSSIDNGYKTLVQDIDYTVSGDTVAIKKAYLDAQPVGTTWLTFYFSAGIYQVLTITVSDSTSVDLNKHETTIGVGKSETLVATVSPDSALDKTVTWASSNESIANVDENGVVTGVAKGSAMITVTTTYGGLTDTCTVMVKVVVTAVELNKTTTSIDPGKSETLIATVSPSDATIKNVTWTSSDAGVAMVSAAGVVNGIKGGVAVITATTTDGGFKATCEVTVNQPVTSVSLDKTTLAINAGDSEELNVTINPSDANDKSVVWISSNENIATVDENGVVTGVAKGSATITVTTNSGSKIATCQVTVNQPVTSVSLNKEATAIDAGKSETLVATVSPANATDKTVTWSSSDAAVATVTSAGVVNGLKAGIATITVTTTDGGFTATCEVTVNQPVTSVSLDKSTITINAGDTDELNAIVGPEDATDKSVVWSSNNENIATVDENGVVTGVSKGTATITITTTSGSKTATCTVTVNVAVESVVLNKTTTSIDPGKSETLIATISPSEATVKTVTWTSSDTKIATVTSGGAVNAIKAGMATITVTTADGGYKATCEVTVNQTVTSVSLDKTTLAINAGDSEELSVNINPSDATDKSVVWVSSNDSIATVDDNGVVTGVAKGTATITVTTISGSKTASCKVTVNVGVESVSLNKDETTIDAGKSETLVATVSPATATNKTVAWTSSDTKIVTVSAKGVVKGINAGTATITVTTTDGNYEATCEVTVNQPVTSVTLDKKTLTVNAGDIGELNATVGPEEATDKSVVWSSSNKSIATVDENGIVNGISKGSITITVTTNSGGKKATCKVTVNLAVGSVELNKDETTIDAGKSETLVAKVSPVDATIKTVTWASSDPKIATVSNKGVVKGIKAGTVTITVKTTDGGYEAICEVTVNQPVTSISLDKKTLTVNVGFDGELNATVGPESATEKSVVWSSSNESIATVENGVVTGVGKGSATITATTVSGNKKATCKVTVNVAVESVELNKDETTIDAGKSETLVATVGPTGATVKTVTWTSSNPKIATVSNKGVVKGIKAGTVTITVKTTDGGYEATCEVTVNQPVTSLSLDKKTLALVVAGTYEFTLTVNPSNATDQSVTWISSNTSVATIDQNGEVTAVGKGSTTITVTSVNGKKATCKVTVK